MNVAEPALPAGSVAVTTNVWAVRLSPVNSAGDSHVGCATPSSSHVSVAVGSSEEKMNSASVLTVVGSGPESIVTTGAVTSGGGSTIVHVQVAGADVRPARSVAVTANVCNPSPRPVYTSGGLQGATLPSSVQA